MEEAVIIDTDAGLDDAWALFCILVAHKDPSHAVRLVGINCVEGNTALNNVCVNVSRVLRAAGVSDVSVFRGCGSALAIPLEREPGFLSVHGQDGFGDAGLEPIEPVIQDEHAVLALLRLSHQYAGRLKVLAIGPLTNLAMAVRLDPTLPSRISELHIMGGNIEGVGNITVLGEFNFRADPEAAYVVLAEYTCPIILTPWEVIKRQDHKEFRVSTLAKIPSNQMKLMSRAEAGILKKERWSPADALAAAALIAPQVFLEQKKLHATVELSGNYARGMMVLDHDNKLNRRANVTVAYKADTDLYRCILAWSVGGPKFL